MTILADQPLTLAVPLHQDPTGVVRVGKGRVMLEVVIYAYQQGEPPEGIIEMYPALELGDVYAVIAYYLAHRPEVDEYWRRCDEEAAVVRKRTEASQPPIPTKEELLARARAKGLNL
ncbi:MAG TPA: DUF433 domain-containing protein [Pirellulales bacterium]|nr:DUF433 domain-containing protein [Pirellulales bacterium]